MVHNKMGDKGNRKPPHSYPFILINLEPNFGSEYHIHTYIHTCPDFGFC